MSKYDFSSIEKKWQKFWEENQTFRVTEDESFPKEKRRYVLDMFPYPSGAGLHVGHPEGYTATDIYCRYLRMNGFNVLHPMGFDSFGLPAENYAIKTGTHPKVTTEANIERFRTQIKRLGFCYDWSREISTHEEEYYRWTQWLFLKLFEKGLAYESDMPINWCPDCKTGLANEEVKDGFCERCGAQVTRKNLRQWVLKITAYAEQLLSGLENLDWPESVKTMQRNWIGRSQGANVRFELAQGGEFLEVYTTRPDTLFGATYMVIAPEHPLVDALTTPPQKAAVDEYRRKAALKSDLERTDLAKDKTGVFTGSYAVNPVNGKEIPIWISDYILISYGTGAIMAVPAHDQRDWEFAKKFDLPMIQVLEGGDIEKEAFTEDGIHINSEFLNGLDKPTAIEKIIEFLEKKGVGERTVNYKLRDWIFSRQRYWGEPIPLIHCPHCGTVAVPENQLPLRLPQVQRYEPTGTGESPLAAIDEWVNTVCPKCGSAAKRETNTMPQWAGSCWYYLRYIDPHNSKAFVDPKKEAYWMPVDLYVGGAEHAVLHLLYSRFWHKVFYDLGLVKDSEPFKRLINQGMITSFAYQRKNKTLVAADCVEEIAPDTYIEKGTGEKLEKVIAKMSKSLKNVINPDDIIRDYGADSMRLYEMFMGPLSVSKPWQTEGLAGVHRFLERIWRIAEKPITDAVPTDEQLKILNKTVKKVKTDTENLDFNTAIAQMMIFVNAVTGEETVPRAIWESFVLILAPYAPHLAEELWERLGGKPSVANQPYPSFDDAYTVDSEVTLVVQINGKVRSKLTVPRDLTEEEMKKTLAADSKINSLTEGKTVVKTVYVPNRIVNLIIK